MVKTTIFSLFTVLLIVSCNRSQDSDCERYHKEIRLATYNTGSFAGEFLLDENDDGVSLFKDIIKEVNADILFTQEDIPYYTEGLTPYEEFFANFSFHDHIGDKAYNYYGVYSQYPIISCVSVPFENFVSHTHFMVTEINIDDTVFTFANIHLDWSDVETRRKQLEEVGGYMEKFHRPIIIGDFNPDNYKEHFDKSTYSDFSTWEEDFEILTSMGYEFVNAGRLGYYHTYFHNKKLLEHNITYPVDNIMFFPANLDLQFFRTVYYEYMDDHCPLCATFCVK